MRKTDPVKGLLSIAPSIRHRFAPGFFDSVAYTPLDVLPGIFFPQTLFRMTFASTVSPNRIASGEAC